MFKKLKNLFCKKKRIEPVEYIYKSLNAATILVHIMLDQDNANRNSIDCYKSFNLNYMQEALKNPHYKKILEKVIMNRHHKAKSLEEAFEMEKENPDCLISIENDYILQTVGEMLINCKLKEFNKNKIQYSYIGRPIILEDIFYLFSINEGNYGIGIGVQRNNFLNPKNICEIRLPHTIEHAEWILGNPLHEQTPKTWEKIANLI